MKHQEKAPIILVIGTRPEAIKLIPVYFELKKHNLPVILCSTFQHKKLLQDVYNLFSVQPDISLDIMKPKQDLTYLTCEILKNLTNVYKKIKPGLVITHGDTTTTMAGSLAAFYLKIKLAHVEAGLRTGGIYAPYPEEFNRKFVSLIANYNFAPTKISAQNLVSEGVNLNKIFITGNTVVDAIKLVQKKLIYNKLNINLELLKFIKLNKNNNKKIVLLTVHRRESWHELPDILLAIKNILIKNSNACFVYPVHPNPVVKKAVLESGLSNLKNILILDAVPYHELIYLLTNIDLIITDSGGIQEEGAALGKKVLVLRDKTDRPESVFAGLAEVIGTNKDIIIKKINKNLELNNSFYLNKSNIFGDGDSSKKIVNILLDEKENYNHESYSSWTGVHRVTN